MADCLVERLLDNDCDCMCREEVEIEAADEIGRLNAELLNLKFAIEGTYKIIQCDENAVILSALDPSTDNSGEQP